MKYVSVRANGLGLTSAYASQDVHVVRRLFVVTAARIAARLGYAEYVGGRDYCAGGEEQGESHDHYVMRGNLTPQLPCERVNQE